MLTPTTYRVVQPAAKRLAPAEQTYPTVLEAAAIVAAAIADGKYTNLTGHQRLEMITTLLNDPYPGEYDDRQIIRYADTKVVQSTTLDQHMQDGGIALVHYAGLLDGTWADLVTALLADLLSDAEYTGVEVVAKMDATHLPEDVRGYSMTEARHNVRAEWVHGLVYELDGENHAVFADGHHLDLTYATFVHAVL